MRTFGLYINGQYVSATPLQPVTSPAEDHETFAQVPLVGEATGAELAEAALQGVSETFAQIQTGFFPLPERLAFLARLRSKLQDNIDFCATLICKEVGKPIKQARSEVTRSVATLEWTLRETPQFFAACGLPVATETNLEAFTLREARGPLLAITPFNFPINLVMHKLAPALAAGCPVILKPSPKAAACALALADLCHAAGLPAGLLSVLNTDNALAARLTQDERIAQVSFTGSAKVGWSLMKGLTKPVFLEMGGNAPVFVDADADLARAATLLVTGGMAYAGQLCISVQNITAHAAIADELKRLLRQQMETLAWGRPSLEGTVAGGVIDAAAATRLHATRERALRAGARLVAEAPMPSDLSSDEMKRAGTFVRPALFEEVPPTEALANEEVFGPYLNFDTAPDFDAWLKRANAESHRFQTAVFTRDLKTAFRAVRELRYGAVAINESTSFRFEPMPFGGRGLAGNSREGPRYALESFTELKSALIRAW